MTSQARQNERVRPDDGQLPGTRASRAKKRPLTRSRSSLTWFVAACAVATAMVVKVSQVWLERLSDPALYRALIVMFDWAALILCVCALVVLMWPLAAQHERHRKTQKDDINTAEDQTKPNIALPAPDDETLRLAQSLSHELRTPLNAVIGFSDLMNTELHGTLGHPKYQEYCAHISASGQSLLRTVDDLLALNAQLSHRFHNRVPLPIVNALRSAWEDNIRPSNAGPKTAELEISGASHQHVIADPSVLSHALKNILETLLSQAKEDRPVTAVIELDNQTIGIRCSVELDPAKRSDEAPLVKAHRSSPTPGSTTGKALTQAAAIALVNSMGGSLTIHPPGTDGRLELECRLPAPSNDDIPSQVRE